MMVSLNYGNHPQISDFFRVVNPYDLSRSVCILTQTLLQSCLYMEVSINRGTLGYPSHYPF